MTPLTLFISALLMALIVASFAFMGGAVPVAIPAAILLIAVLAWGNYARRHTTPTHSSPRFEHEREKVDGDDALPAGDPSTLYTSEPRARTR